VEEDRARPNAAEKGRNTAGEGQRKRGGKRKEMVDREGREKGGYAAEEERQGSRRMREGHRVEEQGGKGAEA
jgi:hypothetical protein